MKDGKVKEAFERAINFIRSMKRLKMLINVVPQSLKSADVQDKLPGFSLNCNNAL